MISMNRIYATTAILILLASLAMAASPIKKVINQQSEYLQLDNGLQVVIKPDASLKLVHISSSYRFGAAYDRKGKSGLAKIAFSVMERMISKGYEQEHSIMLQTPGAKIQSDFGRDVALFTTTAHPEQIETVLGIEVHRMKLATIDPLELEKVKRIMMSNFLKARKTPPGKELQYLLRGVIMHFWEYYHKSEGKKSDVQIITLTDVERCFSWFYAPDNAALVIAGPINAEKTKVTVQELFSKIPPSKVKPRTFSSYSVGRKAIQLLYPHEKVENPALGISYRIPPVTHPDFPLIKTLYHLLFHGEKSRFVKYLKRAGTDSVKYFDTLYENGGPGILGLIIPVPSKEHFESFMVALQKETDFVAKGGFSDTDLRRALSNVEKDNRESLDAENITRTIAKFLLIFRDPEDINQYFESYRSITSRENIKKAAEKYLSELNKAYIRMIKGKSVKYF